MPAVVEGFDLGHNHMVMRPGIFLGDMRQGCGPPVSRHGPFALEAIQITLMRQAFETPVADAQARARLRVIDGGG